LKSKRFWNSSGNRYTVLGILIAICAILYITFQLINRNNQQEIITTDTGNVNISKHDNKNPGISLDITIDSILYTFGIKKEWITTEKNQIQKKTLTKASWFSKIVLIPKEIASAEINLDISTYLVEAGLSTRVNEEIITKDITIYINDPDTLKTLPAAVVQIIHSEKVKRSGGTVAIILDKISDFDDDALNKYILTKNEFSYIFPRNLDDINIQHKLLQRKKDIVINLTIGGTDNYEADFNTALDEKAIRERVRSFNADFSTINKVMLTKSFSDASLNQLQKKITAELAKYNIAVINDTMLTPAYKSSEKDKIGTFFNTLIQKAELNKNIIVVYPIEKSEFTDFYNRVLTLKKLGHKFFNLTEFFNYTIDEQKKEQERLEKLRQEQLKKKKQEDQQKNKSVKDKKKETTKKPEKRKK